MLLDGSNVNFLIAFIAGLVSFLAPCLVAVLPVQLAYLSSLGDSANKTTTKNFYHRRAFVNSLFYVAGFLFIFILLGVTANGIGLVLAGYRTLVEKLGGILLILLGVHLLGSVTVPLFYREFKFNWSKKFHNLPKLNAFLVGLTFGFAWTPCIGPVLAVILYWASEPNTFWRGFYLLLFYGLGLAIPFLVFGIFIDRLTPYLTRLKRIGRFVQIVTALIVIATGTLLLTGNFQALAQLAIELESSL